MKILIVEDSPMTLSVLKKYVKAMGMEVMGACCGQEGVDAFLSFAPDIVLLDVVLPDFDGFAVARRIRDLQQNRDWTPIIFLSSRFQDKDIEQGIASGGDDYLQKPLSATVLNAKIRAMQRILQMRTSLVVLTRKLDKANQELLRLSNSDGLTGISNRRYFDTGILRIWVDCRRSHRPLSLLMMDVDFFKRYNDNYGHQAGDDCLQQVAQAIDETVLVCDDLQGTLVARYGGEEFVVVLPGATSARSSQISRQILKAVDALHMPHCASNIGHVTLSIGQASCLPRQTLLPNQLISAADEALYAAKYRGRHCVCRNDKLLADDAGNGDNNTIDNSITINERS